MNKLKLETEIYLDNLKKFHSEINEVDENLMGSLIKTVEQINTLISEAQFVQEPTISEDHPLEIDRHFFRYKRSILCSACNELIGTSRMEYYEHLGNESHINKTENVTINGEPETEPEAAPENDCPIPTIVIDDLTDDSIEQLSN